VLRVINYVGGVITWVVFECRTEVERPKRCADRWTVTGRWTAYRHTPIQSKDYYYIIGYLNDIRNIENIFNWNSDSGQNWRQIGTLEFLFEILDPNIGRYIIQYNIFIRI